jgi:hypothetical protein
MRRSLRSSAGRLVSRPVRWRRSKDFVSEIDQLTAERGMAWTGREAFLKRVMPSRWKRGQVDEASLVDGALTGLVAERRPLWVQGPRVGLTAVAVQALSAVSRTHSAFTLASKMECR